MVKLFIFAPLCPLLRTLKSGLSPFLIHCEKWQEKIPCLIDSIKYDTVSKSRGKIVIVLWTANFPNDIISPDIISAPICVRRRRTNTLANRAHPSESTISERYGIISPDIIPRRFASDQREDKYISKSCASLGEYHVQRTWYNIGRYYTCADSRPTNGRTNSLANRAHPSESTISPDIIPTPVRTRPKGE